MKFNAPKSMSTKKAQKPQNVRYVLKRLGSYLLKYKKLMFIAIILSITSNLLALLGPMLSGKAVDAIEFGPGKVVFNQVFYYCFLMLVFYVVASILSYVLQRLMIKISQSVVYQMRKDVFNHLEQLPVGYFDTHATGDILSKISYDIDTVNTSLSNDVVQIISSVITVIGSLGMMIAISPMLLLVFCFTVPLSMFLTKYMTSRTRPLFSQRSAALGELNGFVEEMVSGQKTIKAYHQEQTMIERFDKQNDKAVETYYRADYYGSMVGPTVNFVNNLSLSLISVFGALLFLIEKLSLGDITSFVLYSRKFSGPINEAANIVAELQSALAAGERVFKLIDELPEPLDEPSAKELDHVEGKVSFENVCFGYSDDKMILKNVSFEAQPGQTIAIVGPTGAGKTTIINLLMRFYDPQQGKILLDGKDILSIKRESLRQAFSMVLQDTWLFEGSIFDNIAYGKADASLEDVMHVAKVAKIHHFIMQLPQGYNTLLTNDGINISKGQKQLLTIARAMLLDSKILILDEATSNVDTRTEKQIQAAMLSLMEGKTCFVIAHRLSTIKNADLILVVKDGNIIEQGTHQDLIDANGFYASLYQAQFE